MNNVLSQISTLTLQIDAMNESIKMTQEDIETSKKNINEQINLLRKESRLPTRLDTVMLCRLYWEQTAIMTAWSAPR